MIPPEIATAAMGAAAPAGQAGTRIAGGVALAAVALVVAAPFFWVTTFIGDDHLFLAFSRYAPNPFVAFVRDQHGGEYYRPLPMVLWWVLGRIARGSPTPFAAVALGLHAAAAIVLGILIRSLGRSLVTARLAGAIFFLAPQTLEAAYWYAASTDLLATVLTLGSLAALLRHRMVASVALSLAAYSSKETALVLPILGWVVLSATGAPVPCSSARLRRVAPHAVLVVAVLVVRCHVLGGWGRGGDAPGPLLARVLQIGAGLLRFGTGTTVLPPPIALAVGGAAVAMLLAASVRRRGSVDAIGWAPFLFAFVAVAPTVAAGWIVGARYFYLPAAGLAWAAGEALQSHGAFGRATVLSGLLALGGVQAAARRAEVVAYVARVAAVRAAVAAGSEHGHRVFHVSCGIKDLDLVIKGPSGLGAVAEGLLVLSDVPESFASIPVDMEDQARILTATPPLPPSGAYRFGAARIVGLARRGEDPSLAEVHEKFPDLRLIRMRIAARGVVEANDLTDEILQTLD